MNLHDDRQHVRSSLHAGKRVGIETEVSVTTSGLLAIAVLVSGILLSTAVLVSVTGRQNRGQRMLEKRR